MMAARQGQSGPLLSVLLEGMAELGAAQDREIAGLALDSRTLPVGGLFLACRGGSGHGLDFVDQALQRGAAAIAWEPYGAEIEQRVEALARRLDIPLVRVERLARLASLIAARFYGFPSRDMTLVGITGTNGKTSVSHLLAQTLGSRSPCGIVGTLGVGYLQSLTATGYTTPDAVTLQGVLADLRTQGCQTVAMEVSSHALDQERAAAVQFDTAVFTNISRDHFDYHGSMENYAAAKQRLFHMPGLGSAVINLDDPLGARIPAGLAASVDLLVYTLDPDRAIPQGVAGWVRAASVQPTARGLDILIDSHWGEARLHSRLLGRFNAANLLAVLLVLMDQGWSFADALEGLSVTTTVAGRMEAYGTEASPTVVIDYAHTPDALEKALQALRSHCSGSLTVVFGCGGDRDRGKRPQMGQAAERLADRVILSDDNPRSEPGEQIIQEILAGMTDPDQVQVQRDRAQAIRQAVNAAALGDLVLVAGKGHEDYQQVGTQMRPFSDQQQVLSALAAWEPAGTDAAPAHPAPVASVHADRKYVMSEQEEINVMTLSFAAQMLNSPLQGEDRVFSSVSTDTRTLEPGALFVALQGPHFDGHRFIAVAKQRGAAGAVVSEVGYREAASTDPGMVPQQLGLPWIPVEDTRLSLGQLAAAWRQRHPVPLVAVTGSNGKTTVKEMVAAILRQQASVLATQGNLNNDIGMPLTLLRLRDEKFAVLEMGANHPGEIAYLTHIARPDVAVITNAGAAHLQGFGDLEGVARAKGEILAGLNAAGVAVLNADDPHFPLWRELAGDRRIITFGLTQAADVYCEPSRVETRWSQHGFHSHFVVQTGSGEIELELSLAGQHNLANALAGVAVALALELPAGAISQGLASIKSMTGRLQSRLSTAGIRVIDDSYNANPDSVAAAIHVLRSAPGRRWLVLGDLAELGEGALALHGKIGDQARAAGIDFLWAVGPMGLAAVKHFGRTGQHFTAQEGLIAALKEQLETGDTVLVKGSRSAAMEQVVDALLSGEAR